MAKAATGHIPEQVQWDQAAILAAIRGVNSGLAQLTNLTGNPLADARGTVVREVTAERLLETLDGIHEQAKITNLHLEHMTEQHFEIGD